MEIEEGLGYIGDGGKICISKEDAIWSFIFSIIDMYSISTIEHSIRKDRKRLIGLLQLLDKEIELNDN